MQILHTTMLVTQERSVAHHSEELLIMNTRTVVVTDPHGSLTTKRLPVTPDGWAALHPSGQVKAKKLAQMTERLIAYRASQAAGVQAQKAAC